MLPNTAIKQHYLIQCNTVIVLISAWLIDSVSSINHHFQQHVCVRTCCWHCYPDIGCRHTMIIFVVSVVFTLLTLSFEHNTEYKHHDNHQNYPPVLAKNCDFAHGTNSWSNLNRRWSQNRKWGGCRYRPHLPDVFIVCSSCIWTGKILLIHISLNASYRLFLQSDSGPCSMTSFKPN